MIKPFAILGVVGTLALTAACGSSAGADGIAEDGRDDASQGVTVSDGGRTTAPGTGTTKDSGTNEGGGTAGSDGASGLPIADAGALDAGPNLRGPLVAYASGYSSTIHLYKVNEASGALTAAGTTTSFGTSPSFLAVTSDASRLYAVNETSAGKVGAYTIDPGSGALTFLAAVASGGAGPAFVGFDRRERFVFVANYDGGTISVLPIQADGSLGAPLTTVKAGTDPHMMIADPTNRFVFVPCLGSDYVAQYAFDANAGTLMPNKAAATVKTATGAGPRHLAFHPNGRWVYGMNELDSSVTAYALDGNVGTLSILQTLSSRSGSGSGANTGAEIWVHPSGNWVIGSNRGDDTLVVFAVDPSSGKLTLKGHSGSGGAGPRDFAFDPSSTFVYAADQGGNDVAPFRFDGASGVLSAGSGGSVSVTAATFVKVVRLPGR